MFAGQESYPTVIEARYIVCPHCGHSARTGLKINNGADQLTSCSRGDCPRCGEPADIRSGLGDDRIIDACSRMHVRPHPLRLNQSRLSRWLRRWRMPLTVGALAAMFAAAAAPAMAEAVTQAMDQEVAARSFYPASRNADDFCDARIRAYRATAAHHDAWRQLEDRCPSRIGDIQALLRPTP